MAKRLTLGLLLAALLFPFRPIAPAAAQDLTAVGPLRSSGPITTQASVKLGSHLRALVADLQAVGISRDNAAAMQAESRFSSAALKVDSGARVQVYVHVADTADATLAILRRHGLDIELVNATFSIVQGWILAANLEAVAGEPAVVKIRPPSYGTPHTGAVNTQGDAIHRCDQVRATGITGVGVKVGVISDGVNGLAASQAAGELPAVQVLAAGSGDEGTAMLEIVHDCAPGASLAFAGMATSLEFIQAVNNLAAAGATIVVDDVGFPGEPYFSDGTVALSDRAVGTNVLRVSSAGNYALAHYQANFSPGVFDPQVPGTRHNFGAGDTLLRFTLGPGSARIVLQWANVFGGSGDDYDVCVRLTNGALVACGLLAQDGNDDPLEIITLACPGPQPCVADIQITLFSGSARPLELYCFGVCQFLEFNVFRDSIFGHAAVPEVLAVAASPASNPSVIELFSSAGPSTILFPAPEVRAKPDVTGIDGVATSRPGFNPFFGTSAAAPHVAAVAALARQKNPELAPAQLRSLLTSTAIDLGSAGFDFDFGHGRADALSALAAALPSGVHLVVRGMDNAIHHNRFNGTSWTGWTSLPGRTLDAPILAATGTVQLVVRGTDNGIYHNRFGGGQWLGWTQLPGSTSSSPALAIGGGLLHLGVRGTDNGIYHNRFNGLSWLGWVGLPGATVDVPAIVASPGGVLNFVVRGTDNGIYHNHFNGAIWSGWSQLPGATVGFPALVASEGGVLNLVVRGTDNGIYHNRNNGISWLGWVALPGATVGSPALAGNPGGVLDLVVRGTDNGIYHNRFNGVAWLGWTGLPGATADTPVLASAGNGTVDLAIRGTNNHVYHNRFNGVSWSGWTQVGGVQTPTRPAILAK
jgi:subtilisin family serine protease